MIFLYRPQTQYENLGDALIAKNLLNILSNYGQIYIDDKNVPSNYMDIIKNQACIGHEEYKCHFAFLPFKLRLKGNPVCFVFKPGHFFGDTNSLGGWKRILIMTTYLTLLKLGGIKFIRTGVSIGPLKSGYMFYERFLNRVVSFTGVRENKSIKYLSENGINLNVKKVKDLAFWSLKKEQLKLNEKQKYIAYSFRSFDPSIDAKMARRIATILVNIHNKSKRNGVDCKIISVTQVQRDAKFNSEIKKEIININPSIEIDDYYYDISKESYCKLKEIYSKTNIIFSNRLHALLYAFESGVYPVAMGNAEQNFKVKYVLEDTLLEDNFIDITGINFSDEDITNDIVKSRDRNQLKDINYNTTKITDFIMVE
ncbi:polysaccharide pyruvyl transferase family protein [Klebsiella oxytoca]|uniref:Polysaccharide pyruvyl transferase domain-containing protein n=1 Tax=Klebsiella oxytoca TaxID=571 RepID=A0A6B8MV07_KLEOX|nr:polysaccharide pyruvyl transferase family protein [Klebsiella oxytoca]QGN38816.1 hypothetical protein GJ746_16615 [Klebsiella oxytoca]